MRALVIMLAFAFYANFSWAEEYEKGRMRMTDGSKVNFYQLKILDDSVTYKNSKDGDDIVIKNDKILELEAEKGNEGLYWAAGLGVGGLIGASMGKSTAESDAGAKAENGNDVVLTIAAACAAIGYIIGINQKQYEKVYSNPKYTVNYPRVNLLPTLESGGMGLLQVSVEF